MSDAGADGSNNNLLSLKWNNHLSNFRAIIASLQEKSVLSDATLACDGQLFPVHKLILSTCSDFFGRIFASTPCKHPVIVLHDLQPQHLHYILSYMYAGEVNVPQAHLPTLIRAAETLQIKGLAAPDEDPAEGGVLFRLDDNSGSSKCRSDSYRSADNKPSHKSGKRRRRTSTEEPDKTRNISFDGYMDDENVGHDDAKYVNTNTKRVKRQPEERASRDNSIVLSDSLDDNIGVDEDSDAKDKDSVDVKEEDEITAKDDDITEEEQDVHVKEEACTEVTLEDEDVWVGGGHGGEWGSSAVPWLPYPADHAGGDTQKGSAEASVYSGYSSAVEEGGQLSESKQERYRQAIGYTHKRGDLQTQLTSESCQSMLNQDLSVLSSDSVDQQLLSVLPRDVIGNRSQDYLCRSKHGRNSLNVGQNLNSNALSSLTNTMFIGDGVAGNQNCGLTTDEAYQSIVSGGGPAGNAMLVLHNCSMCPKAFQSRADVVRHLRTHTGEKPFKCSLCDYSAALKGNLKSHMMSKHSSLQSIHVPNIQIPK